MAKTSVRLTIRPDEPWEVDEDEIPNLRAQGLLIEDGKLKVDEQAAEYEAAKQRGAEERAAATKAVKAGSGQKAGE